MPIYFIDTDDGSTPVRDDEGFEFSSADAARIAALDCLPDMARDKMPDGDHRTFTATAYDERGNFVYCASLTLDGSWTPRSSALRLRKLD